MSQKPIEALGKQITTLRAALGHMLIYVNAGVTCCRACGYFIGERTPEEAHAPECIALWLLRTPLPSPESLATLTRWAEIGELLQQLQVAEPWFTLRYESVPGSSRVQTRVATPHGAFKADLFTEALRTALSPAPEEPTP